MHELSGVFRKDCFEGFQQGYDRNRALVVFADARNVDQFSFSVLIDDVGFFLWNDAEFGLSGSERGFCVQPFLDPSFIAQDFAHFIGTKHAAVDLAVDCSRRHFLSLKIEIGFVWLHSANRGQAEQRVSAFVLITINSSAFSLRTLFNKSKS